MIFSDWHIHSDASYDAKLPLETLIATAKEKGFRGFGVTDHLNYNDESF
jgi:histidinol phosphatase-like PHP family hydrolase